MSVSCKHLFISIANLSWTELNILNQYPCMLSWRGVFEFSTFLGDALSESRRVFVFGSFLIPFNTFPMLLIDSAFLFFVPIFCSKIILFPCHTVVGMSSCILLLFSFPSFASTFWLIYSSCIVCFTNFAFFRSNMFHHFSFGLSFLLVVYFLSEFPVEFPIQVLSFCSCSSGEHRFFHRLISLLHKLVRLIP